MTRQLSYPLPSRHWVKCEGGWYSEPWTKETAAEAIAGGGWFYRAPEEEKPARERKSTYLLNPNDLLKELSA